GDLNSTCDVEKPQPFQNICYMCPPEMWPNIFKKAKEGGLNVIQTYVFWNIHELVQGQAIMSK
ncbi:hypothetical protein S83_066396, partial [Arachis hypogaea]